MSINRWKAGKWWGPVYEDQYGIYIQEGKQEARLEHRPEQGPETMEMIIMIDGGFGFGRSLNHQKIPSEIRAGKNVMENCLICETHQAALVAKNIPEEMLEAMKKNESLEIMAQGPRQEWNLCFSLKGFKNALAEMRKQIAKKGEQS